MKKWLLILGMITCMAGLTACGGKEAVEGFMTPETAETYATENIAAMNQVVMQGAQAQVTDPVWTAALDSWETASEEMGSYVEVISVTSSFDDKDGTIDAVIKGNTLLGMGTVFVVLILISLLISCFTFIPKIQAVFSKKPKEEAKKEPAVDKAIAQIVENEELSDDLELVAVISAAIAASEGAASTDGFVVRSIRRASKWQRA